MTRPPGPFTNAPRRGWPAVLALFVLVTPVAGALLPPGPDEPTYLAAATVLAAVIALSVLALPWRRLPAWAQTGPPLAFFLVVILAQLAVSERSPSLLPLMLLPVLWIATNGTRRQVSVSLVLLTATGVVGVLGTDATPSDWRRAVVSLLVAGLIGLSVQRVVETSRRSEARYRTLVEHLPDMAVMTFDRDLRYDLAAGTALDRLGIQPSELEGRTFGQVIPDEHRPPLEPLYRAPLEGEEASMEYRAPTEPPRDLWLRAVPLRENGGRVQGGMVVAQDVTERNRAEASAREAQELFRRAFEDGEVGMAIVSLDGHYLRVNRSLCRILDRPEPDLVGRSLGEIVHPDDFAIGQERLAEIMNGSDRAFRGVARFSRPDEGTGWIDFAASLIRDEENRPLYFVVQSTDITEQRRAEQERRQAEERFRRAFEDAGTGMAVIGVDEDNEGHFLEVNDQLCQITGYPREQLLRMTEASLLSPDDLGGLDEGIGEVMAGDSNAHRAEVRLVSACGGTVWVSISNSVVRDSEGTPQMRLVQMLDISERKRFEGQLQHLADHDPLTGLINRRRFEEELERELIAAKRYRRSGAVLVLDLDNFKYVNDTLGHSAGDELIVSVSALLRRRLRESDTLARIGGDEFAVILPDCTPRQAEAAANGLLATVREGMLEQHRGGRSSASIGVAPYSGNVEATGEELLVEADVAMYEAKERGRDRVECFEREESARSPLHGRLTWARRIEQALTEDGFELHAQPILSLGDDPTPRHELLVRMTGENGDLIPPAAFLGVAERFELIQSIDRWVVGQAIDLLAARQRVGDPVRLEINLSAKSVTDPDLPDFIEDRLRVAQVDPRGLIFEVTETAAIVNVDRAQLFAERLGEVGCGFALDDFGAGFASFYYLKHLDFDLLKIDGEFIRGLPDSRTNQLVVRSLVDLAQGLGKDTVAEFVGDEQTLELLRSFGVDYAQGFHVGRPVPIAEAGLVIPEAVHT